MKNILFVALTLMTSTSAMAGFMHLDCAAFRVSQDSNENIQKLEIKRDDLSINGVNLNYEQLIEGSLYDVYPNSPATATYKSLDGKGDYKVSVTVTETITSVNGHASIGRDHTFDIYKAVVKASRNGKTHEFVGTCTSELMSSCGGACEEESSDRDQL